MPQPYSRVLKSLLTFSEEGMQVSESRGIVLSFNIGHGLKSDGRAKDRREFFKVFARHIWIA